MRKFLLFCLLGCASLYGAKDSPVVEEEVNDGVVVDEDTSGMPPPFLFTGTYVDVAQTDFYTPEVQGQHLKYRELDLTATYTHAFSRCWGLGLGAGYIGTEVNWPHNPDFHEKNFQYVILSFHGYTMAVCDWIWKAGANILFDTQELSLRDYTLYQGFLYGKYTIYPRCLNFQAGFLAEIGLHKEKIWPVLGFEYTPWRCLALNAVFPLDISANYFITKDLTVGLAARFLRNRHRVKNTEPLPMGIFEYRTTGAEGTVNYSPFRWLRLKAFAGRTFDGDLKITDRNNHHATHYKFRGSLYGGVSANAMF